MPNYLVFHALTTDAIHACAWSMIKYLEQCNLKPVADDLPVVYTTQPAYLESFSSFFQDFQFRKPAGPDALSELQLLASEIQGNLLYISNSVFPTASPDSVFRGMERGSVFKLQEEMSSGQPEQVLLLGFHTSHFQPGQTAPFQKPMGFEKHSDIPDFNLLLRQFFKKYGEESVPNLIKLASTIDINKIREQKLQYQNLPLFKKLTRKVRGKGWNIADFVR